MLAMAGTFGAKPQVRYWAVVLMLIEVGTVSGQRLGMYTVTFLVCHASLASSYGPLTFPSNRCITQNWHVGCAAASNQGLVDFYSSGTIDAVHCFTCAPRYHVVGESYKVPSCQFIKDSSRVLASCPVSRKAGKIVEHDRVKYEITSGS